MSVIRDDLRDRTAMRPPAGSIDSLATRNGDPDVSGSGSLQTDYQATQ